MLFRCSFSDVKSVKLLDLSSTIVKSANTLRLALLHEDLEKISLLETKITLASVVKECTNAIRARKTPLVVEMTYDPEEESDFRRLTEQFTDTQVKFSFYRSMNTNVDDDEISDSISFSLLSGELSLEKAKSILLQILDSSETKDIRISNNSLIVNFPFAQEVSSEEAVEALFQIIKTELRFSNIQAVEMHNCRFTNQTWLCFIKNIQNFQGKINSLSFSMCNLSIDQVSHLNLVKDCISQLKIIFQTVDESTVTVLGEFISYNQKLEYLSLKSLGMTDKQFEFILSGLEKNRHLKKLILDDNEITNLSAFPLSLRISLHPTLESLALSSVQITDTGLMALANAAHWRPDPGLELCLEKTAVGDVGVQYLLKTARSVKVLELTQTSVESPEVIELAMENEQLKHINVMGTKIIPSNLTRHSVLGKRKRSNSLDIVLSYNPKRWEQAVLENIRRITADSPVRFITHAQTQTNSLFQELENRIRTSEPSQEILDEISEVPSEAMRNPLLCLFVEKKLAHRDVITKDILDFVISIKDEKIKNHFFKRILEFQFKIMHIPKDGDCLFRACVEGIERLKPDFLRKILVNYSKAHRDFPELIKDRGNDVEGATCGWLLRLMAVHYMQNHPDDFRYFMDSEQAHGLIQPPGMSDDDFTKELLKKYCVNMTQKGVWGGEHEIQAFVHLFNMNANFQFGFVIYDITSNPQIVDGKVVMPEIMHKYPTFTPEVMANEEALKAAREKTLLIHLLRTDSNHYSLLMA